MIGDRAEITSSWPQPAPGVGAAGRCPRERGRQLLLLINWWGIRVAKHLSRDWVLQRERKHPGVPAKDPVLISGRNKKKPQCHWKTSGYVSQESLGGGCKLACG